MQETKEEILTSLDVIEERLITEHDNHEAHLEKLDELLSPIRRRFNVLQRLHLDITPLAKKVAINDTTTNLLRSNTTVAKQALAQMDDMDTLRKKPVNHFDMELSDMMSQVMTAMSVLRETLTMIDRYMARSEAWKELKPTMELRSIGIEKTFLDEYPATSLNDYLKSCPSASHSSAPCSSPVLEGSPQIGDTLPNKLILEPWTSASSMTASRTSYVSTSEVLSAKMGSVGSKSHEWEADHGGSDREVNVDLCHEPQSLLHNDIGRYIAI
ncbi:hypothetical protein GCK32_009607 [Trichostrongylus colubriformis]|uniref:Uncharacterized protein n=1 Tax=Trichostrongylus colubriformis TaxID=6319 RepID=A0AAN8G3E6_TRICO